MHFSVKKLEREVNKLEGRRMALKKKETSKCWYQGLYPAHLMKANTKRLKHQTQKTNTKSLLSIGGRWCELTGIQTRKTEQNSF